MKKIAGIQRFLCCGIGILCFLYYVLCGFYGGFHISILWIWIAAGIVFLLAGTVGAASFKSRWARSCRKLLFCMASVLAALFFVLEAMVFSGMSSKGPENLDYVIILGAAVNGSKPSGALEKRIATAYEYLKENPGTRAVASGGQGAGEEISEAECIAGELIKRGISPERIYLEDRSATTAENMRFSYKIIGSPDKKVGIVTSDFHVYRSLCTARKAGFSQVYGIAAPYSEIMRLHYAVREFAAFIVDYYLGNVSFMTAPSN